MMNQLSFVVIYMNTVPTVDENAMKINSVSQQLKQLPGKWEIQV
jgi:hypothetical protein